MIQRFDECDQSFKIWAIEHSLKTEYMKENEFEKAKTELIRLL